MSDEAVIDKKKSLKITVQILVIVALAVGVIGQASKHYKLRFNGQWDIEMSCGYHRWYVEKIGSPESVNIGDVVIFTPPNLEDVFDPKVYRNLVFAKQVMAVEGDEVRVEADKVFINGEYVADRPLIGPLQKLGLEKYISDWRVTLKKGELFVMGERKDKSFDSRYWGLTNTDNVTGEIVASIW